MKKDDRKTYDGIGLRSEEVQEVMGRQAHWMCRWGMTLVAALCALLLGAACLIDYPDTLTLPVEVDRAALAADVTAPITGKVAIPLMADGSAVAADDTLCRLTAAVGGGAAACAPVAGWAYACDFFTPGQTVTAGTPLLIVVRHVTDSLDARAYVAADVRQRLAAGEQATLLVGTAVYEGRIAAIARLPRPTDGRFAVAFRFAPPIDAAGVLPLLQKGATVRIPVHDQTLLQAIVRKSFLPR